MQRYVPPFLVLTPALAHLRKLRADGVGEADMRHQPFAEEGGNAAAGTVEELVGDDEIERAMFFFERPDGAQRNDAIDSERFHAVDIRPEIQLRRRDAMPAAVASEEGHVLAGQRAQDIIVRGIAEGSLYQDFLRRFKSGHGVEAAAADDSDFRFQFGIS
jgi:hypothetical protein